MIKKSVLISEAKEVFSISLFFFICFSLFVILKKLFLAEYQIEYYGFLTAAFGGLVLGKVVLIFDKLKLTKQLDHLACIYRVFFRSFIYLFGYISFTFLEHAVLGLFHSQRIWISCVHNAENLTSIQGLISLALLFITFLIFNFFWVIRSYLGPKTLTALFFKKGFINNNKM